jgi:hypothetical protein
MPPTASLAPGSDNVGDLSAISQLLHAVSRSEREQAVDQV